MDRAVDELGYAPEIELQEGMRRLLGGAELLVNFDYFSSNIKPQLKRREELFRTRNGFALFCSQI